jgi:hypothetical protein
MPTETAASKIMLFRTRISPTQLTTEAFCQENGFAVLKPPIRVPLAPVLHRLGSACWRPIDHQAIDLAPDVTQAAIRGAQGDPRCLSRGSLWVNRLTILPFQLVVRRP